MFACQINAEGGGGGGVMGAIIPSLTSIIAYEHRQASKFQGDGRAETAEMAETEDMVEVDYYRYVGGLIDYTVKSVYSGHPSEPYQLKRWPDYRVEPSHPSPAWNQPV